MYAPIRPGALDGVAQLTVYRAVNVWEPVRLQEPMFWVRQQWAFNRLLNDPDPELAAVMHNNQRHGDIPKLWAEVAYEIKRREIAPNKVSRLDALYACFDPLEAFLMVDAGVAVTTVWRGEVSVGVRWSAAAFLKFEVIRPPLGATRQAFADAWPELFAAADEYWTPTPETPELEVLVDGEIELADRVMLREVLESEGVLGEREPPPQLVQG